MFNFCFKILLLSSFFWYLVSSNFSYSQNSESLEDIKNTYKKGDIDLYISPFALLEPRPTICLGSEYFIKDRFSIRTDLGYMINLIGAKLNTQTNLSVSAQDDKADQTILNPAKANYVIKPEIRWYREGSQSQDAFYYGIRLMWRNANFLKNQRTYEKYSFSTLTNNWTGLGEESISIYKVKRTSLGIQFLVGWKNKFIGNLISDYYLGAGVRYISNVPTHKAFDPFEDFANVLYKDLNIEFLKFNKQYKIVTMDFAIGMRFGSKIKR